MPLARPLGGYIPVPATPFDAAGRLMEDGLATIIRWHLDNGAEGLCVAAGNGECAAMTADEVGRVVRIARGVAGSQMPIISGALGATADTVDGAAAYVRAGMENGADAVLVTPHTSRPDATRYEVVARYHAIADATGAPIVAYNSPRHFGVTLDVPTLAALADAIDLVGLKEASRDFDHIGAVVAAHGARVPVFVGPGWFIMPGAALGAAGFLSTGPDLLGPDSARIMVAARAAPDASSRTLHHRVAGIYRLLLDSGLGPSPAPLKAALTMLGLPAGFARDPVKRLDQANAARLRDGLSRLGLLP